MVVKMCDMDKSIAIRVFKMLNGNNIKLEKTNSCIGEIIITDIEPKKLIYPEGWYYAKGTFRNKHTSTTGWYAEVPMRNSKGEFWQDLARYCTRD